MYEAIKFRFIGRTPLIHHSSRLVDPLDPATRALAKLSSTRKKTEETHLEIARAEWFGSLLVNADGVPCVPGLYVEAMLVGAAKKSRLGTAFKAAILCDVDAPLIYDGPKSPEKLWENESFRIRAAVRVSTSRIMRTRPIFISWSIETTVLFMSRDVNRESVIDAATTGGRVIGLGDWRPRFGRFDVEVIE